MGDKRIREEDVLLAAEQKLRATDLEVVNYTLEPVKEKIGLLGDHAFLKVTVRESSSTKENHLNFFVKLFPKSAALATFAQGAGAFEREEFTYKIFSIIKKHEIPLLSNCTACCYIIRPNEYLILDDLSGEGFQMPNKNGYLEYDRLLIVLHSLAQLHASTLIFEEKQSQEFQTEYRIIKGNEEKLKETFYSDVEDFSNRDTIDASLKCILTEIQIFNLPEILNSGQRFLYVIEKIYSRIYELVKPSQKFRNVLCHGDIWASNVMLKTDQNKKPISCKIVDFQSVRYVPPAHDVLSVIYLTTSRDFREQFMYQIIGIYYSYLEKHVKMAGYNLTEIIPFSDFMESCEEQKLFAVLFAASILPLILSDRDVVEKYVNDKELYRKVFRGDRSVLVYDNQGNEKYMQRLRDSVQDLKEQCEKFRE